jgi:hypothetical protein
MNERFLHAIKNRQSILASYLAEIREKCPGQIAYPDKAFYALHWYGPDMRQWWGSGKYADASRYFLQLKLANVPPNGRLHRILGWIENGVLHETTDAENKTHFNQHVNGFTMNTFVIEHAKLFGFDKVNFLGSEYAVAELLERPYVPADKRRGYEPQTIIRYKPETKWEAGALVSA